MACGCGKKGTAPRRVAGVAVRPTVGPRPMPASNGATPATVRALSMQKSVTLGEARRMDEQRRKLEKMKRDAIQRKLNKP